MEHNAGTVCDLYSKKFNQGDINFVKIKDHCHYTEKYQVLRSCSFNM